MTFTRLSVLLIAAVLAGCEYAAVQTAPKKQAAASRTEAALNADRLFWETLHGGDYAGIPKALEVLTAAYLENPGDAVSAAHVGWLHIWRLAERARMQSVPPTITEDAVMARKFFQEAVSLNPSEARYLGFLASAMMAEGSIHKDEKLVRQGYFRMLDSVKAWPEFNLFTAGYVMSRQPRDSERFKEGLENQWRNMDLCVGEKIDRKVVGYEKYMALQTTEGVKRVCWNSWIAPHNFEGFFLNMGDMLVKSGDWQTGQKIYATAKLSPDYGNWKYRGVLEERIREAESNVRVFNAQESPTDKKIGRMMANSEFACMACHLQ
jgi:translation initiation factor 2 beta subunit (eIF-2beta)/eIF-5